MSSPQSASTCPGCRLAINVRDRFFATLKCGLFHLENQDETPAGCAELGCEGVAAICQSLAGRGCLTRQHLLGDVELAIKLISVCVKSQEVRRLHVFAFKL
jgi:hypothetical protein